jgi:hypothetical protein
VSISESQPVPYQPRPVSGGRWLKPAIKLVLTAIVLVMAGRHVARTWADLHSQGRKLVFDPAWLSVSLVVYVLGLSACGLFFGRVLRSTATPIGLFGALRGYLVSHLGKYVPGKALVVVMRVALVHPFGARPASAAIATFYETLVMMAAGGMVATLGFLTGIEDRFPIVALGHQLQIPLWLLGVGAAVGFLIVVEPAVFPMLGRKATKAFKSVGDDAFPRFTYRLLAEGLLLSALAWVLLGLSQVAVLKGIGVETPSSLWPRVLASVALATVAGFAVPISPGGLGVREWVLWTALGASFDRDLAVVAALTLRLVWFVGEAAASALLLAVCRPVGSKLQPEPRPSAS